jgi:hypothetical protein
VSRPVTFTHRVLIDGTDVAGITLSGASIRYGTDSPGTVPEAASAYLELISADAAGNLIADYPEFTFGSAIKSGFADVFSDRYEGGETRLKMGTKVEIGTSTPTGFEDRFSDTYDAGFDDLRFSGYVTSLDVTPALVTVTAVAPSEQLTRMLLVRKSWPAETDIARVARIATATGVSITIQGTAVATVCSTDDKATDASAWSLLSKIAEDTGALLYANRTGEIIFRTKWATAGSTVVSVSPGSTLLDGYRLTQELGSVINSVEVKYGETSDLLAVEEDIDSITDFGLRSTSRMLDVVEEASAREHAEAILDRHAAPRWSMTAATVNLRLAGLEGIAKVTEILDVDLDDDVLLPQLLPASPIPDYQARVLGYTEILDPYAWTLAFALDPAGLSTRS